MSQSQDRVLLIYNHWQWSLTAILSLMIRMATYGPNHAALLIDGHVHEMTATSWRWMVRKLLGLPVSFAPNAGSGYKVTPYEQWCAGARRQVVELRPLAPLNLPQVAQGYGYLDLIQIFLHIIRTKWLLIGSAWNGQDGCRLWPGTFCSEFVAQALGRPDAHILTPADLQHIPELEKLNEFTTTKK